MDGPPARLEGALERVEPRAELLVGLSQRRLRLDPELAREVRDREEQVPHLFFGAGLAFAVHRAPQLGDLLLDLVHDLAGPRPVEADGRDAGADFVRAQQRRQRPGHAAQDRAALAGVLLLARLDRFPLLQHLARRPDAARFLAEDVRVTAYELRADRAQRVADVEPSFIELDLGQEDAFEEQVADFPQQRGVVAAIDRVQHLVGLLQHEAAQRLDRLLAIPGTAARSAQPRHDVDERLELAPRGRQRARPLPGCWRLARARRVLPRGTRSRRDRPCPFRHARLC